MPMDDASYIWVNSDSEPSPSENTKIDEVRKAMTIAAMARCPVRDLYMHPNDWIKANGIPLDQLPVENEHLIAKILQFEDGYCVHVHFKEKT